MPSNKDRTHQFSHSSERRASIVYGSVGKGGLFIPSDFIKSGPNETFESMEALVDEDEPLDPSENTLLVNSSTANHRRKSNYRSEAIREELHLLKDHNIDVENLNDLSIRDAFEDAVVNNKLDETTWGIELRALFRSSIPLAMTFLLQNSLSTVSVLAVGHLGATELAAVSMGAMTASITGYATIHGLATCLDTLCPQAFGAKKYTMVGIYTQKCVALISTVMLPILIAWIFFGYELITLILPDKETAHLSAVYLRMIAAGIPAYIVFECGMRFLQAQGVFHISTYVLLFAAPLNVVMNFTLVKHFGYLGAPIAVVINYWLMGIGMIGSIFFVVKAEDTPAGIDPLQCWGGLDFGESFKGWGKLTSLAIPSLIMVEAEFLAFEILTLLSSYLGTVPLAAQSIGTTLASLTYQIPFAIGIALSTRIANYLGAGLSKCAKKSTQAALTFGFGVSLFNFVALFLFKNSIARLFTNDNEVIKAITDVMWIVAVMQISDCMNANSAGCLRGQGQTKIGGIVNLISYYVVGIPLSIYLTFYSPIRGQLDGLWYGSTVALTIIGTVQSYYAYYADFNKLCAEAEKRSSADAEAFSA